MLVAWNFGSGGGGGGPAVKVPQICRLCLRISNALSIINVIIIAKLKDASLFGPNMKKVSNSLQFLSSFWLFVYLQ